MVFRRALVARLLSIVALMFLLAGCGLPGEPWQGKQGRVWVFTQALGNNLQMDVHLEAADGSVPTGARVWLTDPGGGVYLVSFDSRSQSYHFEGQALHGEWRVEVDSLATGRLRLEVPVYPLTETPAILSVQDGTGHRAENYERLQASEPIYIEWREVLNADIYLLEVFINGIVVNYVKVQKNYHVLPPNTIPASNDGTRVSLRVTASSAYGDVYFSNGYYSTSATESRLFSFEVVP